jgi:hypothetical protein
VLTGKPKGNPVLNNLTGDKLIKETFVTTTWNGRNKVHFMSKGYTFTKCKDLLLVNVNDLTSGSHTVITAICDVCGHEKTMKYKTYLICYNKFGYYCCDSCSNVKYKQRCQERYGVDNSFQLYTVKEKSAETNISKYGVQYITQNEEWKLEYVYGDKNNFWIDGRNKYTLDRSTSELKTWRKKIYAKDNNTCQYCGGNHRINAHHIYTYHDNKDIGFEIDNGITLCKKCHIAFHKEYGMTNNYNQLITWLKEKCNDYRNDISIRDIRKNNGVE